MKEDEGEDDLGRTPVYNNKNEGFLIESEETEDEEEVLTMDRVRFNSLCILPSQIECCSLEYQEKKHEQ